MVTCQPPLSKIFSISNGARDLAALSAHFGFGCSFLLTLRRISTVVGTLRRYHQSRFVQQAIKNGWRHVCLASADRL